MWLRYEYIKKNLDTFTPTVQCSSKTVYSRATCVRDVCNQAVH